MKKIAWLVIAFISISFSAMADQLAYMSEKQAKAAVELLQKQQFVLLYCPICDEQYKIYVELESVSYRFTNYMDYFEVLVEGIDSKGNNVSETIDLAYAYIMENQEGRCICDVLSYGCPEVEPKVQWECPKFQDSGSISELP